MVVEFMSKSHFGGKLDGLGALGAVDVRSAFLVKGKEALSSASMLFTQTKPSARLLSQKWRRHPLEFWNHIHNTGV